MKDLYSQNSAKTNLKKILSHKLKNIPPLFAFIILTCVLASACGIEDVENFADEVGKGAQIVREEVKDIVDYVTDTSSSDKADSYDSDSDGQSIIESASSDKYPTKEMKDDLDEIGLSDDTISVIRDNQESYYYYSKLGDDEQNLYAQIYYILYSHGEYIYITSTDMDEVEKVQQCVLNDHPEIFYVDGYTMKRYMDPESDDIKALTYGGKYTLTQNEITQRQIDLDKAADSIIANAPDTTDEYAKVKYFYDYIVLNTEYVVGSEDNQNICSVLLNKSSVCQGYAKTLQYLLQKVGITCEMVSGTVNNDGTISSHAWNLVKVNGNWYYVDPTWGDSSFTGSVPGNTEVVNYAYLCVTTADLNVTHTSKEVVSLPECISTTDNYFVRENALFSGLEYDKLSSLFDEAIAKGQSYVTFKCTSKDVYNEMKAYLFSDDGGKVFEYLPSDATSAAYMSQDTTLTFIIWL